MAAEAATITAEPTPKTGEGAAPASVTGAPSDRDAADAKAWEAITGAKPETNENPTVPDMAKMEAEGKTVDPKAPARDETGKFLPKDKTEPEGEAETAEPEAEKPAEKKPEAKPEPKPLDRDTRRKIIAAKEVVGRILKWDDAKIEATDPHELIALGQSLKPVFQVVESLKTDLQKWKDKARGQKPTDLDTPDDGPGRTGNPVDRADTDPAEREPGRIGKLLRDYLDPDTLKEVESEQRAERARFNAQAAKATERAEAAETRLRLDRIEVGRDRVAEKFPQLKDDARFEALLTAMDEMDPTGERASGDLPSFIKFMERVAWSEFGEDVERTTRHRLITGNRRDANGQPETASQSSQAKPITWDEYENYAAHAATTAVNKADYDRMMARVKRPARPSK